MGSHIPIRQFRRSSVNARLRGATLRGLVASVVFTNTWATSFPSLPILCFEAFPPVFEHNRGVAPAEQRYLLRILRFSVFSVGLV